MIEISPFGSERARKYHLVNEAGMQVNLTNFGARIVEILLPVEEDGGLRNVSLSASSDEEYKTKDPYPGATIVPVAGRISKAQAEIKGKVYHFTENEPGRTLHGGVNTANEQYWDVEVNEAANSVCFTITLSDGSNGFPGDVRVKACYRLTEDNTLEITYTAQSDKDTIFNPTNHVYFNLTGDVRQDVADHQIRIAAETYAPLGEDNLPLGRLESVEGTPFDFRVGGTFAQGFTLEHPQNQLVKGYDHPWVLNQVAEPVEVVSPDQRIRLTVTTNQPAVVIYTYNFPSQDMAVFHGAFSLECQGLPNACNVEGFGSILLEKDQLFEHVTSYKFTWF
ncbi:galactose-1-epimerase [Streptococcus sp. zg-86]|uniref:Aldose 1-epimerase n=1 Tax=Streptococcus zhangguiae TaxID=2664091 RepID=A0A6I4RFR9_9STRE|nr:MULTISPECIES: aldose epimerase family protein [unclassified Streptococcus]MTB64267.1 galactose-1-epimerase [Streptococcus sp. zg-86]MTB90407.1 galactose-1-epimerase [Streptococcus sp. zg-36]MWV56254.1 galactose-1-epimerase [Streptococcus sp. zg-70]QTH48125.1 galactose mutarotase [Streptococcus sp. zg-86]